MKHILISGEVGVGKSTILYHLVNQLKTRDIYGFHTKKIDEKVYIGGINQPLRKEPAFCVAHIFDAGKFKVEEEVFEARGVELLQGIPKGSLVIMDELGFLESRCQGFCHQVEETFQGDYHVLGVIKPLDIPFLKRLREREDVHVLFVDEKNREKQRELGEKLMKIMMRGKKDE